MASLAKPPTQQRQGSRPNSASSSSVITVQRASSVSARNGTHPPVAGLRSQSPNDANTIPTNFSGRTLSPETTKRRSSALYTRPDSGNGFREGVGNLNRWSQSTASSKNSAHNRRSSFSKRLSGSFGSFGGFAGGQTPSPNATFSTRGRPSPQKSPPAIAKMSPPSKPASMLPPIVTLSSLSQAVDAADSPSTVATVTPATADILSPLAHASTQRDYFGDRWSSRSPTKQMVGMKRPAPSHSPRANKPSPIMIDNSTSPGSSGPPESVYSPRTASRLKHASRRISQNGHHRRRDDTNKGSGTAEGESSASDNRARADRVQKRKAPSQKAMLSKALQKAHHAVTLDQHSNYEGAMYAYQDACALLQKVMIRSSGIEDREKLDAVRNTYEARIAELRGTDLAYRTADGKSLPQRPPERDSKDSERLSIVTDTDDGETAVDTATVASLSNEESRTGKLPHLGQLANIPPRRQSLQTTAYRVEGRDIRTSSQMQDQQPIRTGQKGQQSIDDNHLHLSTAVYQECMPPPLSPRRPLSPALRKEHTAQSTMDVSAESAPDDDSKQSDFVRQDNGEHTSWLNTINESSGSSASSVHVHSRRSSVGLKRKHIRAASGQTEAEFDAALDAAVEAAYDDGFEPDDEGDYDEQLTNNPEYHFEKPGVLLQARRDVEPAQGVREAEREAAISRAKEREKERLQGARDSLDLEYSDDEADEEERMLEEMTRDYIMDDEYDIQTKSALPRQSDSSGFSGRTWVSSFGSNPTSAGTSLSTVAEASILPSMAAQLKENPLPPPLHPPPSSALPPPPSSASAKISEQPIGTTISPQGLVSRNASPGVRERRLSGMKRKPLKIETHAKHSDNSESEASRKQPAPIVPQTLPTPVVAEPPKSVPVPEPQQLLPSLAYNPAPSSGALSSSRKGSSPFPGSDTTDQTSSTASALTRVTSADSDHSVPSMPGSPARFAGKAATGLRKNFSSSSLRNQKLTVVVPETHDTSSNASVSSMSSTPKQQRVPSPAVPVLPTPLEASFIIKGQSIVGPYLFDNDIHSPTTPGSPNPLANHAPLPLEPCPVSALLRPFWFLRSIYQTIAHPRGGYVSNRLFVPRDIWRVKNIKLKNVEEKVSSCDLLTAALLKLGKVDNLDANAVKDEMEFFETVMEQVHSNLSKKLGSEVGVQGAAQLLKSFGAGDETAYPDALAPKTTNASSKSYLSWRKLRNKSSSGPSLPLVSSTNSTRDGFKETPTLRSVPMTSATNPRFPKRDVNQIQCVGPNPSYMGALARLCDAAQVLDQIIRQVEDPGLKHSSPTHVGLELSARHAAEFFGFIVCRFVLADIGTMLDKYIKRGSEWVLA